MCQFHVGDKESVVAEGTDYYLSVMFHHKNHLTRSLTCEATGVRCEPGLTWPLNPAKLGAKYLKQKIRI